MRFPWVHVVLLVLLPLQLLTGLAGLINGSEARRWILDLHSMAGYAIVLALGWKGVVIWNVLRRHKWTLTLSRFSFLMMLVLVVGLLTTGILWTHIGPIYMAGFSLMTLHALMALGLVGLLIWHLLARRWILRVPRARSRRTFLALLGTSLAGAAGWQLARVLRVSLDLPGARRRFTGSYETGSFSGRFPIVSWLLDFPPPVTVEQWMLVIDGAVSAPIRLTYAQLQAMAVDTFTETLDCTGGWYSTQVWEGVRLSRLLDQVGPQADAGSISVEAVSGYGRRFSLPEARHFLLATRVAGRPLDHGHGFPARLVAPGHRGFEWVKWVTRIQVHTTRKIWQSPLPLQ